jgi:arylsulfatase A-like enzyme
MTKGKLCFSLLLSSVLAFSASKPNVVLIFIDDMGYGDIGPFGNTVNKTPNLDRMADEGNVLTQFYVSNTACTPSRSALMTGTYAHRIGMDGVVCFPGEKRGLNPAELTIAEALKSVGYMTGAFGKWHMGDQWEFLPLAQGFDEYYGIPYSNDMWPGNSRGHRHTRQPYTPLPVIRNEKVVAYVSDGNDQALLCRSITDEAIDYIKRNRDKPFFVYLPFVSVHRPRYVTMDIGHKAEGNIHRAVVEEVDTHVGRVLDVLRELEIEEDTLVIFTSDNGPATGMTAGPLRGAKGGPKYEGHMREPTLAWWPGTIPAGIRSDQIVSSIDVLPSLAALTGAELPEDRITDGKNSLNVFLGKPNAVSKHPILYYEIDGIRRDNWKLVRSAKGKWELYDLGTDVGERQNIAKDHPEMVQQLTKLLNTHAEEIEQNSRPPGMLDHAEYFLNELGATPRLRDYLGVNGADVLGEN